MILWPPLFALELGTFCNARCTFCLRQKLRRRGQVMDAELVTRLAEQIPEGSAVFPHAWDEPLANPCFWESVDKLSHCAVSLYTNGSFLDEQNIHVLTQWPQIKRVWISINGSGKEAYERAMPGLIWEQTVEGVQRLLAARGDRKTPEIRIQGLRCPENADDCDSANLRELFPQADAWCHYDGFNIRGLIPELTLLPNPDHMHCARAWFYMYVNVDGLVCLCCNDIHAEVVLGDAYTDSLQSIWYGEETQRLRNLHASGLIGDIPLCANCDEPVRDAMRRGNKDG